MRLKILQGVILVITIVFASVVVISPITQVSAANLLQDAPSLDGYKIYFTEANGEASRFDRSAEGLSRFAGLLS